MGKDFVVECNFYCRDLKNLDSFCFFLKDDVYGDYYYYRMGY